MYLGPSLLVVLLFFSLHLIPFITLPGVKTSISFHKTLFRVTPDCVLVIIERVYRVSRLTTCHFGVELCITLKQTRHQGLRTHFFWALTFTTLGDNEKWRVFQTDVASVLN